MESHDSLPYIDSDITSADRDAANQLIEKQLPRGHQKQLHPSINPLEPSKVSRLIQIEIDRHAAGNSRVAGIDSSRYEAPDELADNADVDEWKVALKKAYTASTYLSGRHSNLALLEEFGKNAWLISNYELEGSLKSLEDQLADVRAQTSEVNKARKIAQESSKGEIVALEDAWRNGIGKIIEVQVATEQLRAELQQRRRNAAS